MRHLFITLTIVFSLLALPAHAVDHGQALTAKEADQACSQLTQLYTLAIMYVQDGNSRATIDAKFAKLVETIRIQNPDGALVAQMFIAQTVPAVWNQRRSIVKLDDDAISRVIDAVYEGCYTAAVK